ncbi:MAG: helix-turn-helix transcriptional regulator [Anaerolineae bacterium]|nr:helix-turn-helix transcriptional regulator [Anaerolineae bacterium]
MTESVQPNVGLRLRLLRERKGLSLRALAQQCGLSINAISRIERGDNSPTVSSLHLLASALKVPITAFFEEGTEQAVVLVRRSHRRRSEANGVMMESLGIGLHDQQLEPFLVTVESGAGSSKEPITHAGEEFVYCVEGTVVYQVNNQTYALQAGDSLLFEAALPHCFYNDAPQPAILLLVFQTNDGNQSPGYHHLEG